jgi:phosphatidylglycerophosphate synthase
LKVDPVLSNLLGELRAGRFRPRAVRRFVNQGIGHAIDLAWSLKGLRRSFYVASAVMAVVLVAMGVTVHVLVPGGLRWTTILGVSALYVAVFGLTLLQLGLVRSEVSGEAYERFTFPNVLTLLRLLSVPYLVDTLSDTLSSPDPSAGAPAVFGLMMFAVLTDTADGFFARLLRQTSEFGRIYDPVVDIVFHVSLGVTLYAGGVVASAYLGAVLLRYLLPPVAGFFLYLFREPFQVKSTFMGKLSSLVLSVFEAAVAATLVFEPQPGVLTRLASSILEPACVVACAGTVLFFVGRGLRILHGRMR